MEKLVQKQTVTISCRQMGSLVTLPRYIKTIKQNVLHHKDREDVNGEAGTKARLSRSPVGKIYFPKI